jgi:hypothetical protein
MAVWLKNGLTIAEWGAVQFRLIVLQHETRKQMAMLVHANASGKTDDVFVALPDDELTAKFPDFTAIAQADIPNGVTLLVGADNGFAEKFPDVALKLRGLRI